MNPKTILIATPYFLPKIGGLETYAYKTALQLQEAGWRVVIVCGDHEVKKETTGTLDGLTIYRLPIWKTISNTPINLAWPRSLRRIIAAENPNVINAHTPVPFMVDMVALAAGRRPLVITYHAATLLKPGAPLITAVTKLYQLIERSTLARATHIIAVSDYVKLHLPQRLQAKTSVVYNAVDQPIAPQPSNSRHGLIFIANLEPTHRWKGLAQILEALSLTPHTNPDLHLTVVGEGAARAGYEAQVKMLGLSDRVHFTGRLGAARRDEALDAARVLIAYPTTANDAFPTVILEAWSHGLAVVAAAIGPIPSLIKPGVNGVLVPPSNPRVLAAALEDLIVRPNHIMSLAAAGRHEVEATYNWPTQSAKLMEILERLL